MQHAPDDSPTRGTTTSAASLNKRDSAVSNACSALAVQPEIEPIPRAVIVLRLVDAEIRIVLLDGDVGPLARIEAQVGESTRREQRALVDSSAFHRRTNQPYYMSSV